MNRQTHIRAEFVEFIPERLEPGKLYISRRYSTATHLCCCGCGMEVVTPLNPAKWHLSESRGSVSLSPSIGNWSFPCQSHYWITEGRIEWASAWSSEWIAMAQQRDREDAALTPQMTRLGNSWQTVAEIWLKIGDWLRSRLQ